MNEDPRYQELRERLFARYDKKLTSFNTLFTALVIFGLFFFAFVLVPYVVLQVQTKALHTAVDSLSRQITDKAKALDDRTAKQAGLATTAAEKGIRIEELSNSLSDAEAAAGDLIGQLARNEADSQANAAEQAELQESLQKLEAMLRSLNQLDLDPKAHVMELRSFIVDTQAAWEENKLGPDDDCVDPDTMKRATCRIQHHVERQIDRIFAAIDEGIIQPFTKIDARAAADLTARLEALRADTNKRRMLNPDFWRTVSGKELFFTEMLEQEFDPFVSEIAAEIAGKRAALETRAAEQRMKLERLREKRATLETTAQDIEARRQALQDERVALQAELDRVSAALGKVKADQATLSGELYKMRKARDELHAERDRKKTERDQLETRLSAIQSPFGALPVGLDEAILAYPIVIAAGFVLCGLMLADAVRLRRELHAAWRRWDPEASILDDRNVTLIAPLWLEPHATPQRRLRLAAFGLPGLLFMTGIALIVYGWTVGESSPLGGRATQGIYALLYAGSFAAAVGVVVMLRRVLGRYDAPATAGAETETI